MKKIFFIVCTILACLSFSWGDISSDEFKIIATEIAQGGGLTKKKYNDFWSYIKTSQNKKTLLDIIKNGIYTNLLLQIEILASAIESYDHKTKTTTPLYKSYMSDAKTLMPRKSFYYLSDDEYRKMIEEYNIELASYSTAHNDLFLSAANRVMIRNELLREFQKIQLILKNLEILFTENYKGDFPN